MEKQTKCKNCGHEVDFPAHSWSSTPDYTGKDMCGAKDCHCTTPEVN